MEKELFDAIKLLEKEKGISSQALYNIIANSIVTAAKADFGGKDAVSCEIDPDNNAMRVFVRKNVVSEISDEHLDILAEDAQKYRPGALPGDIIEIDLDVTKFGRIAAQKVKHGLRQGIRDVEQGQVLQEFQSKKQEIVNAKVTSIDAKTGHATLEIGKAEAILPKGEQIPGETYTVGSWIKIYVVDVEDDTKGKGPKAMISRTHPNLVKRFFEQEVPEIYDGTVEIKSVSREAGSRTKMAVYSKDANVDPVGSCIGPRGARVTKVVDFLGGEKIDIVRYNDDITQYISAALAPAEIISVVIENLEAKSCRVVVPDSQLSLAIGNKGQNARLAAKLTGWKIDIKPESEAGTTIYNL